MNRCLLGLRYFSCRLLFASVVIRVRCCYSRYSSAVIHVRWYSRPLVFIIGRAAPCAALFETNTLFDPDLEILLSEFVAQARGIRADITHVTQLAVVHSV